MSTNVQTVSKEEKNVKFITKKQYDSIDECNCGGPVFKYNDTSRNIFVIKCGYFKKIIEINKQTKKKIWIAPKKTDCSWKCIYNGERPVFQEINKKINNFVECKNINVHKQLEEKLKLLFKFLYVSCHSTTLDEINILVENNLLREPRKKFYYPSIGPYMRVSHIESYEDYEKRIFSKKIIDMSYIIYKKNLVFYEKMNGKKETENKNKVIEDKTDDKTEYEAEERILSQFIVVDSDHEESDSENGDHEVEYGETKLNSEDEDESEQEPEEEQENDIISEFGSNVENIDTLDDDLGDFEEQELGDYYGDD